MVYYKYKRQTTTLFVAKHFPSEQINIMAGILCDYEVFGRGKAHGTLGGPRLYVSSTSLILRHLPLKLIDLLCILLLGEDELS